MSGIYYSVIGLIALIIYFILFRNFFGRKDERGETREFKCYLMASFFYYITDTAWGLINSLGNASLLYIDTVIYYVAMALSVVFCCRYVIDFLKLDNLFGKIVNFFGVAFFFLEMISLCVNHFYPIFFWFDKDGSYHAEIYRYLALIVQIVMFAIISMMSLYAISKTEGERRERNKSIFLFGMMMTLALVVQTLYPLLPVYSIGIMLGTLVIHVFIHEEEERSQMKQISTLNEQLREAADNAQAANQAKTSFLFNMSHDIRTPMNAIIGFTNLLRKHQEEPEKREDYLNKIDGASGVLLSIINNVLEMARIEKGTVEINESSCGAKQFYYSLYTVIKEMMDQKGLTFTCEVKVEHNYVMCDATKMREIFLNILSNAYKYTNTGGKVHMLVEELPCNRPGYVYYRTTISDTGMGMSKEFLPHIFEEFSREKNTTENKVEGTGLGMPIVKKLVEILDGTIEVTSEKGVGSTFIVTLPHKLTDEKSFEAQEEGSLNAITFEGKRLLLAEDNDLNAEIATEILTEVGFIIDLAENGRMAVEMIEKAPSDYYSAILMDVQMPELNGYEATRVIRNLSNPEKANIPILAMTANAFEEDKREAINSGMNGHLAKPIDIEELMKELTKVFSQ